MEQRRDQRGLPWLEDFMHDVRYGVRTLRRAPVFTVLAVATLTLAIGANTAIFSLIDPLLFRDLPVRDPGTLVQFTWRYPGDPPLNLFSLENYERFASSPGFGTIRAIDVVRLMASGGASAPLSLRWRCCSSAAIVEPALDQYAQARS